MALGGQWLRRGPVPACAAAPAPRPLPYPPPPTPALPPGAGGHFLQFLCVTCRGAQSSHRTPTHTLPQNRNDLGWGGWEDARGGGYAINSTASRGGGDARLLFIPAVPTPPSAAPRPHPRKVSKCLRPPGSGFRSGFSRRRKAEGETPPGNGNALPSLLLRRVSACVCVSPPVPSPATPGSLRPRSPGVPRPPAGCSALPPALAGPSQHNAPRPTLPAPPRRPRPPARSRHTASRPPGHFQGCSHHRPPAPPTHPGRGARRRRRAAGARPGGGGQGGLAQRRPPKKKKPLGLRGKGGRTDPTRPDPAGRQGRTGGQFYP